MPALFVTVTAKCRRGIAEIADRSATARELFVRLPASLRRRSREACLRVVVEDLLFFLADGPRLVRQHHRNRISNLVGNSQARVVQDVLRRYVEQYAVINRVF